MGQDLGQDPGHLGLCFKLSPCEVRPETRHSDTEKYIVIRNKTEKKRPTRQPTTW